MAHEDEWARDKAEFIATAPDAPHPADRSESSPLGRQFAQLARVLLDADTVADVLSHVVSATLAVIPDADLVSVSLRQDSNLHTPVQSDPVTIELDDLQSRFNEGPCYDAAREPGPAYTHADDLSTAAAWPRFGPEAVRRGYRSVLSTALLPGATAPQMTGALNIYAREPGKLGDEITLDHALILATHASLAIAHVHTARLSELRKTHLERALENRDVIGQAKGILMHRRGITADEAFDLLRNSSQDLNIKLATVARTIAARHRELDLPDPQARER